MKIALLTILAIAGFLRPGAAVPNRSADVDMAQVDGITSKVVDGLWKETDSYWHIGDYNRIIALDRITVKLDPNFVPCYATGGWLMESAGNNHDAEAFYQEAIRNNPSASYAYYTLGSFYYTTVHDYPAAIYIFSQGIKQPDADVNDWKMLAHSYEKNHNLKLAVGVWTYLKKRWPNGPAVETNYRRIMADPEAIQACAEPSPSATR